MSMFFPTVIFFAYSCLARSQRFQLSYCFIWVFSVCFFICFCVLPTELYIFFSFTALFVDSGFKGLGFKWVCFYLMFCGCMWCLRWWSWSWWRWFCFVLVLVLVLVKLCSYCWFLALLLFWVFCFLLICWWWVFLFSHFHFLFANFRAFLCLFMLYFALLGLSNFFILAEKTFFFFRYGLDWSQILSLSLISFCFHETLWLDLYILMLHVNGKLSSM